MPPKIIAEFMAKISTVVDRKKTKEPKDIERIVDAEGSTGKNRRSRFSLVELDYVKGVQMIMRFSRVQLPIGDLSVVRNCVMFSGCVDDF